MAPTDLASDARANAPARQRAVNDFSIQVATVNESGIAAYRSLGFIHHHAYRYLAPAR